MQDKNLSQWFNLDDQKPWEPGVYEFRSTKGIEMLAYWDGSEAFMGTPMSWGIERAASEAISDFEIGEKSQWSSDVCAWRGLASDPSAKPKARGNRRVTRYVVRSYDKQKLFASFVNVDNARVYADSINEQVCITKIRFRTPEAD